jgi:hypothetical protein
VQPLSDSDFSEYDITLLLQHTTGDFNERSLATADATFSRDDRRAALHGKYQERRWFSNALPPNPPPTFGLPDPLGNYVRNQRAAAGKFLRA